MSNFLGIYTAISGMLGLVTILAGAYGIREGRGTGDGAFAMILILLGAFLVIGEGVILFL